MSFQRQNYSKTISDSFLRSYSISRIVKINEENRNKAKVIVMRKSKFIKQIIVRDLNEQNRKKSKYFFLENDKQNKNIKQKENNRVKNGFQRLKNQLKLINTDDSIKKLTQNVNKVCKQCNLKRKIEQKNNIQKKIKINQIKDRFISHRRFNSQAINNNNVNFNHEKVAFPNNLKIRRCHKSIKAQLRKSQIQFVNGDKGSQIKEDLRLTNISLSQTLNSFNRLKLMTNSKSNQRIIEQFYKRSLQSCSIQDLKVLIDLQINKSKQKQKQQHSPMKFGKSNQYNKQMEKLYKAELNEDNKQNVNKGVWNNEYLRKSCMFQEDSKLISMNMRRQGQGRGNMKKEKKYRDLVNENQNQNQTQELNDYSNVQEQNKVCTEQFETVNEQKLEQRREEQIEKSVIYTYGGKRFPENQNRLNKTYENWQSQFLKKKRVTEVKNGATARQQHHQNINYTLAKNLLQSQNLQIRKLRGKSLKVMQIKSQIQQPIKFNNCA